ncbi:MAG: Hsp70 family protein [Gemmataceae bacterium]
MTLAGIDLNATRVRAVSGPAACPPRALPLHDTAEDLPLVVSLEGKRPEVGRAGVALTRRLPHLACGNYLSYLGQPREWVAGRHRLSAAKALQLVFDQLQPVRAEAQSVVLALPPYLSRPQAAEVHHLASKAKLPMLGSLTVPLAAALTSLAERSWSGPVLIVDVDDHALTCTALLADNQRVQAQAEQFAPQIGLRVWKDRLLNGIADRCIRHSRRDPRESGAAEQMLYDQLDQVMRGCRQGQVSEVVIQTGNWYQNMLLRPEDLEGMCAPLVRLALERLRTVLASLADEPPEQVLLTSAASRLPGLVAAIHDHVGQRTQVAILSPLAVASAAHALAGDLHAGKVPVGHFDVAVPLFRRGPKADVRVAPADTIRILGAGF